MSNNSGASRSGGIGFLGLLGILFIGLKLTGYVSWPWLWVLAPLWGPLALGLVILVLGGIAAALLNR